MTDVNYWMYSFYDEGIKRVALFRKNSDKDAVCIYSNHCDYFEMAIYTINILKEWKFEELVVEDQAVSTLLESLNTDMLRYVGNRSRDDLNNMVATYNEVAPLLMTRKDIIRAEELKKKTAKWRGAEEVKGATLDYHIIYNAFMSKDFTEAYHTALYLVYSNEYCSLLEVLNHIEYIYSILR